MRFGNTKGEIRVKKGDFRGDLDFFRGLDLVLVGESYMNHIWENIPKKTRFLGPSLTQKLDSLGRVEEFFLKTAQQ